MDCENARCEIVGVPASTSQEKEQKLINELKTFMRRILDILYRVEDTGDIYLKETEYLGRRKPVIQGVIYLPTVCRMGDEERAEIVADFYEIVEKHLGRRIIVDCAVLCGEELETL